MRARVKPVPEQATCWYDRCQDALQVLAVAAIDAAGYEVARSVDEFDFRRATLRMTTSWKPID